MTALVSLPKKVKSLVSIHSVKLWFSDEAVYAFHESTRDNVRVENSDKEACPCLSLLPP